MRVSRVRWIKKKDSTEAYFRHLMRSQTLLSKTMITSYRSLGLLRIASFLAFATFLQVSPMLAAEKGSQSRRIQAATSHPRQVSPRNRLRTPVASTSFANSPGSGNFDPPVRPATQSVSQRNNENNAGSPDVDAMELETVDAEPIQRTSFIGSYANNCGPVCDCGECVTEIGCGIEQPRVFFEVGCGIESLFSRCRGCQQGCDECGGGSFQPGEMYIEGDGCGMEVMTDCGCDACNPCDSEPTLLPRIRFNWCRYEFFAGVQGHTGPLNHIGITNPNNGTEQTGSGSFGFYEGFNRGKSMNRLLGLDIATQIGVRGTQNNLSGTAFSTDTRHQVFVTAGFFRRVDYGVQYGLVLDYMNQDWYFQSNSLQLRGELSWRARECDTYGFQFMAGVREETISATIIDQTGSPLSNDFRIKPTDQYRFFYRRPLARNGEYELMAGWTDNQDGLLGASFNMPLTHHCSLSSGATYLIPHEGTNTGGFAEENWNISLGLVYRPGGPRGCGRYCRPLFDVADNGTFMLDFQ